MAEKAGVKFIIIRAGIRTAKDTYFKQNLEACITRGIPYGLYWYFEATDDENFEKELAACKNVIKGLKPQYPVFFDMENQEQIDKLDSKKRTDMAIRFCNEMTAIGLPSGIYANPSWLDCYFDKERLVGKYDIWLVHWTESPDIPSSRDYGQTMWQWGVDKIGGNDVDGDICFIDYPSKTAYWYNTHCKHGNADKADTTEQSADSGKFEDKPAAELNKGDEVVLKNAPLYASSTSKSRANTISGTYWIHSDGVINSRIRITTPKNCANCTGWVNLSDITDKLDTVPPLNINQSDFKPGDIVRIKIGAKSYDGIAMSNWVYTKRFYVESVSKDRILLNKSPDDSVFAINTPFNKADLINC